MCESKMRGRVFLLYSPVTTVASVWSTIGHQIFFSYRTRSVNVMQDVKKRWYSCSRFVVFCMKSQWPPLRRVLPLPASEQPSDKGLNHDRLAVHALDQNELKFKFSIVKNLAPPVIYSNWPTGPHRPGWCHPEEKREVSKWRNKGMPNICWSKISPISMLLKL